MSLNSKFEKIWIKTIGAFIVWSLACGMTGKIIGSWKSTWFLTCFLTSSMVHECPSNWKESNKKYLSYLNLCSIQGKFIISLTITVFIKNWVFLTSSSAADLRFLSKQYKTKYNFKVTLPHVTYWLWCNQKWDMQYKIDNIKTYVSLCNWIMLIQNDNCQYNELCMNGQLTRPRPEPR